MVKLLSLTSSYLRVYEDVPYRSNNMEPNGNADSKSKELITIPIIFSTLNVCTN